MANYKHILLAVDFSAHANEVTKTAKQLADKYQAQLSVVHVVDNLPVTDAAYGPIPFDVDFTQELLDVAKTRLQKAAAELNIAEDHQWLEMGSPKLEIVRVADEKSSGFDRNWFSWATRFGFITWFDCKWCSPSCQMRCISRTVKK